MKRLTKLTWLHCFFFSALRLVSGFPPGSSFPEGNKVNRYLALDGAGNTANCDVTFTVVGENTDTSNDACQFHYHHFG